MGAADPGSIPLADFPLVNCEPFGNLLLTYKREENLQLFFFKFIFLIHQVSVLRIVFFSFILTLNIQHCFSDRKK